MACDCCLGTVAGAGIVLFMIYKFFFSGSSKKVKILETDWKKDTVYLYQFPRSRSLPTPSPFCLKLESYLRLHKIQYENRFTAFGRSKYGKLPFIELNGEHIADSQLIVERLKDHFNIEPLSDAREEALSRSVSRHIENHTFYVLYKYKILDHASEFLQVFLADAGIPSFVRSLLIPLLSIQIRRDTKAKLIGIFGDFTEHEFETLLLKDLAAFRDIIGKKKYMFGDQINLADCCLFGALGTLYYQPYNMHAKTIIKRDYPELVKYLENMRQELFSEDFVMKN